MPGGRYVVFATLSLLAFSCAADRGARRAQGTRGAAQPEATGLPTSREALVDAVLAAFAAATPERIEALFMAPELYALRCPERVEQADVDKIKARRAKVLDRARRNLEACAAIDWSRATGLKVEGGTEVRPVRGCQDVARLDTIEATAEVGGERVVVVISLPVRSGGGYSLANAPRCARGDAEDLAQLAEQYADLVCAAGDDKSANARLREYAERAAPVARRSGRATKTQADRIAAASERLSRCVHHRPAEPDGAE